MTIEAQGHVESMEQSQSPKAHVRLTIYNSRGEKLIIEATKKELGGLYLPGTSVMIQVRPLPDVNPLQQVVGQ